MLAVGKACYVVECHGDKAGLLLRDVTSSSVTEPPLRLRVTWSEGKGDGSRDFLAEHLSVNERPVPVRILLELNCAARFYQVDLIASSEGSVVTASVRKECARGE